LMARWMALHSPASDQSTSFTFVPTTFRMASEQQRNRYQTLLKVSKEQISELGTAPSPQFPPCSEWPLNNREPFIRHFSKLSKNR
jgi:hypothetical protein